MQSPEEESQESHLHWLETEWRHVMFSNKFNIFMISLNQNHADKENTKDTNMVKDGDILWIAMVEKCFAPVL